MWMRGRNNFDGMISYLQTTLGMGNATEVILSGGSAGGLGVFYNLDHLATLLPSSVRLTGFPDAGVYTENVRCWLCLLLCISLDLVHSPLIWCPFAFTFFSAYAHLGACFRIFFGYHDS